jgi:DNA-binding transcriptional MerR regulator
MTDLPASTLYYWERQFKQLSPHKDERNNRYYTEKDIELIKQIKYIRNELHITRIQAIRSELNSGSKNIDLRQKVSEILQQVKNEITEIKAKI